jgi:uncharacterized protein (DUF1684 family)
MGYSVFAQNTYKAEIIDFQQELNEQYKDEEESPLSSEDLLRFVAHDFFKINQKYQVEATYERLENPITILMQTSTSRLPEYIRYAKVTFELDEKTHELILYKSKTTPTDPKYIDSLFLPFTDLTNGEESYDIGRYIDIKIPEGDTIIIDFNKSYNPYCAYSKYYSCPVPPEENQLDVEINAGIKKSNL